MADQRLHQFNTGVQLMYDSCETSYWYLYEQIRNVAEGWRNLQLPAGDDVEHPDPHNDTTIDHTSVTEFVASNILMPEEKLQAYRELYDKLEDALKNCGVSLRFVGSLLHDTALTGSDLDIIIVPKVGVDTNLLNDVLPVLQRQHVRQALNINGNINYRRGRVPIVLLQAGGRLKLQADLSIAGVGQLSLSCGHFIKKVLYDREDARLFVCILKQAFMRSGHYHGSKHCVSGVVVTIMVLWSMQKLNMLPVFERYERGVLTPDNSDWEGYWQSHRLVPSTPADMEEDTLIRNFGLVLQTLIDSECRQVMSLHGNMDHIPLQGGMGVFTPPNNDQNAADLVIEGNRKCFVVLPLIQWLKEWNDDPMLFLYSIA
uniref:Polymerase nucleotidyl transferase domain-containing protein n=1 Tax=Panagrolaimus davidi TaxID=227884 RepID=A0A914PA43_9BILA